MWWGAGVGDCCPPNGVRNLLCWREKRCPWREKRRKREREEVKGRQGRDRGLEGTGGSWRQGRHEHAPWGLIERKLGWRAWEQLSHSAGSTQTPVPVSPPSSSPSSSFSHVLVLRSDASSCECVFSTISLFCYLFFILLASTSGDLVVRRIQSEAAQTLWFHCSARL